MNIFSTAISYKNIATPVKLVYRKPHDITHFHKMSHHNAQLDELFNVETNLKKGQIYVRRSDTKEPVTFFSIVAIEPNLPKHS